MASVVKIGPVDLEKISKLGQCIFSISLLSPLGKGHDLSFEQTGNPRHTRLRCAKFGCSWPSGSREEDF